MKKVLVLGGSYFTGRVFNILASAANGFEIDVINRGRLPLNLPGVTEYVSDRHDAERVAQIVKGRHYDAVIDFCAYEPEDISSLFDRIDFEQYVFFSTASVYLPAEEKVDETFGLIEPDLSSEMSAYVSKKLLLERELRRLCRNTAKAYTVLRPAFIYGPFNYAPREAFFIQQICKGRPLPFPSDATASFNFVYVTDIASILMKLIGNEKTYNRSFNLAAPEDIDYQEYFAALEQCNGESFPVDSVTCSVLAARGIQLPFPLNASELYDGSEIGRVLEFSYTPFETGMKKTFASFYNVFSRR